MSNQYSSNQDCYFSVDFPDYLESLSFSFNEIPEEEEEACLLYEVARHASHLGRIFIDHPELCEKLEMLTSPRGVILAKGASDLSADSIDKAIKTKSLRLCSDCFNPKEDSGLQDDNELLALYNKSSQFDAIDPQISLFLGIKGGYPEVAWADLELDQKILKLMVYYASNPRAVEMINQADGLFTGVNSFKDLESNLIDLHQISEDQKLLNMAIDWRKSDRQILASFKNLLHHSRPKSQPYTGNDVVNIFGKFRLTMRTDKALDSLGIWREKCSEDLTWEKLVEHRYGANSSKGHEVLSSETNRNIKKLKEMLRVFLPLI